MFALEHTPLTILLSIMRGARDITNYDKSKQDRYAPLYLSASLVRVKCFGGAVLGGNAQSWVGIVRLIGSELSI